MHTHATRRYAALTAFRLTDRGPTAPSPIRAGWSLFLMGLGLMLTGLGQYGRRTFYVVQAALVWQWIGEREYTRAMAVSAWLHTYYLIILSLVVGRFLATLL